MFDNTTECNHVLRSWRSGGGSTTLPWVEVSHGWVPVNTHSTPVLTLVRKLWVARRSVTTDNQDATTDEPNSLHGTMKSRTVAERMVSKSPIHILKWCLSHDVNDSVACFEEHPKLKFDGCNSKRAVVSAFKNPDTWLKSWCSQSQENQPCSCCTVVHIACYSDSADAQTHMIADCTVPREVPKEIVHDDDHEEETLQSDEEHGKKLKINEAYALLRAVTTPLHDTEVWLQ